MVKEFSFRTSIKLSELEIALKAECNLRDRHKPNSTLPTALMAHEAEDNDHQQDVFRETCKLCERQGHSSKACFFNPNSTSFKRDAGVKFIRRLERLKGPHNRRVKQKVADAFKLAGITWKDNPDTTPQAQPKILFTRSVALSTPNSVRFDSGKSHSRDDYNKSSDEEYLIACLNILWS